MSEAEDRRLNGGSRPVPDPTLLTDQAIAKAIAAQRDWIQGQLDVRDERLGGIDEATKLRLGAFDDIPSRIDEKVKTIADLTTERFVAAERQRVEQKKDTKDAVDAALSAAKEAVKEQTTASERSIAKSEAATRDQSKQQQETFITTTGALGDKIDDLKERVGRIESTKVGAIEQRQVVTENRTALYATIGVLATLLFVFFAVVAFVVARMPA